MPSPAQRRPQSSSESCNESGGAQLLSFLILTSSLIVTLDFQFRRQHPVWLALVWPRKVLSIPLTLGTPGLGFPWSPARMESGQQFTAGCWGPAGFHQCANRVSVTLSSSLLHEKGIIWGWGGAAREVPAWKTPCGLCQGQQGSAKASWHRVCPLSSGVTGQGWHPSGDPVGTGLRPHCSFSLCVSVSSIKLQLLLFSVGLGGKGRSQLDSPILIVLSFVRNPCPSLEFRGVVAHVLGPHIPYIK